MTGIFKLSWDMAAVKQGHWWMGVVVMKFIHILWLSKDECLLAEFLHVEQKMPNLLLDLTISKKNFITPFDFLPSYICIRCTGCSNSICAKKTHFLSMKNALLCHKNGICTFMRCGHLTYDPWIWLKVTSMASTASNRKSAKTPYNSGFLIIHHTMRDQYC